MLATPVPLSFLRNNYILPKELCRTWVSLLFLYGTWAFFCAKAKITSPRADRDLFIYCASFNLSPIASDRSTLSLPARSIKWRHPREVDPFFKSNPLTCTVRMLHATKVSKHYVPKILGFDFNKQSLAYTCEIDCSFHLELLIQLLYLFVQFPSSPTHQMLIWLDVSSHLGQQVHSAERYSKFRAFLYVKNNKFFSLHISQLEH